MKRLLFILIAISIFTGIAEAQQAPGLVETCILSASVSSCQLKDESNLGFSYHIISWVLNGSNSGSSGLLQYSDDTSLQAQYTTLITGTTTSSGNSASTAGNHNRWKLTLSSFTPTSQNSSVTIVHRAYYDNPGITANNDISTVGGVSLPLCNTTVPCVPVVLYDSNGHAILYNDVVSVNVAAAATGGCTPFTYTSAGSSEDKHEWKGSAGTLCTLTVTNTAATVAFYRCANNVSASVTPGSTTPGVLDLAIPGATTGNGFNVALPAEGTAFSTGLTCWIVTGKARSDATEVGADDVKVSGSYK